MEGNSQYEKPSFHRAYQKVQEQGFDYDFNYEFCPSFSKDTQKKDITIKLPKQPIIKLPRQPTIKLPRMPDIKLAKIPRRKWNSKTFSWDEE